ncbi:MAG: histidinol-phosphate transaminase [Verrucomicrobiota bacterium]
MRKAHVRNRPARSFVRRLVRRLHSYVPGEQPKISGLIKLNTNESPYPPSPRVLKAVKTAVNGRLRLYPDPTAQPLREKLAKFHKCGAENIIVGNGSDELLALATRAFVEPAASGAHRVAPGHTTAKSSKSIIQYFAPSYSLYSILAAIHGARANPVPLRKDFTLPTAAELRQRKVWDFHAALTYVTTPNAPSGRGYPLAELETLCRAQNGIIILDEAYVDFAAENALELALKYPQVIVSRTFSKAYSLCFQRVGYFVAHPELIASLDKIRDSYNVNGLGQIAAEATLDDLDYYRKIFRRVINSRTLLSSQLEASGFVVYPSQTNFIFVRPPGLAAPVWLKKLRENKILVRWFNYPEVRDYLRITVGSEVQTKVLCAAIKRIANSVGRS